MYCRASKWSASRGTSRPASGVNGKRGGSNGRSRGQAATARGKGRVGRGLSEAAEALLGMGIDADEEENGVELSTLSYILQACAYSSTLPHLPNLNLQLQGTFKSSVLSYWRSIDSTYLI